MTDSTSQTPRARVKWTTLLLVSFLLLVFSPLLLVIFVALFGRVSGTELSPNSFAQREFSYYEIPYLKLQVMPIRHSDVNSPLQDMLQSQSLLPPSSTSQRWDLVATNRTQGFSPQCDAAILARYLQDDRFRVDTEWISWTTEHPDLAAVFWPRVAEMARLSRYLVIPALFRAAEQAEQPKELESELNRLCTAEIELAAQEWEKEQDTERATQAYEYLLKLHPDNESYQESLDTLNGQP